MARVNVIKDSVLLCGKAGITPFIWGHRGLGKSSVVRQTAADNNMGFIDMRASQMEASDLRGLPDRQDGRTVFLPPADMPRGDLNDAQILEHILAPFQAGGEHPLDFKSTDPKKQHEELLEFVGKDIQAERIYTETLARLQPGDEVSKSDPIRSSAMLTTVASSIASPEPSTGIRTWLTSGTRVRGSASSSSRSPAA